MPSSTSLCDRLAPALARRGVAKGDRVAVLARNSHAFAALRFALARLGAVLVPINFMLKADEVAYILRHAGARMLATDSGLAALGARRGGARHAGRAVRLAAVARSRASRSPGMMRFDALAATAARRCRRSSSPAATSRRSSTPAAPSRCPKGAMLTHDAVIWQYVSCIVDASIARDDLALHALPLYHCAQLDVFLGPVDLRRRAPTSSPPSRRPTTCCR